MEYPVVINRLSDEDGGGYLAYFPDLVGCMSDGETPEEAVSNALLAFEEWMDAARERGIEVPVPHSAAMRAHRDRESLLAAIKSVREHHDELDGRLADIEARITEIEEQMDHEEAWTRFGVITGRDRSFASIAMGKMQLIEG